VNARSSRALRGVTAAAIATFLAAVSHTIGGGTAPPLAVILTMTLLAAPFATAIVGRRLTLWRLSAAVLLSQIAFHTAFSVVGDLSGTGTTDIASTSHVHGQLTLPLLDQTVSAPTSPLMLTAHLAAAAVSAAILYGGERALRALLSLVIDLLATRALEIASLERHEACRTLPSALPVIRAALLSDVIARRGPPSIRLFP
jgi:hypothetical protein